MIHHLWLWILHYTGSDNTSGVPYGFWSGFGSDLGLFAGLFFFLRHKNCHQPRCWRMGRHPKGHFVFCAKHHPDVSR